MKTSEKEYNELLYLISTEENSMSPVPLREDGYPVIVEGVNYYYGDNYSLSFTGTLNDLKNKWPSVNEVPALYTKDPQQYHRIPKDEPVYKIDLNSRTVEAPEFLSVLEDHNAEVIWFKVDRFFDDVDLFGSTCWIQYKNAAKENHITVTVPKVIKESDHDTLYLPWPITGHATKAAGKIEFSFQFFKIGESKNVYFNIHTQTASSKILHGMKMNPVEFLENGGVDDSQINPQKNEFLKMYQELTTLYNKLNDFKVYWLEVN